jgi:ribosomal protein L40E
MKCPKCQTDNKEEAIFCRKCGGKFSLICTKCGAENLPGDNFCDQCGYDITLPLEAVPKDLSFDEKIDKIQRYLPKGVLRYGGVHRLCREARS